MIGEFPLLLFTMFAGLAAGGYAMAFVADLLRKKRGTSWLFVALTIVLLGVGMLASLLHLGHPERFLNSFSNPSSMITQEGIFAMVFSVFLVADLAMGGALVLAWRKTLGAKEVGEAPAGSGSVGEAAGKTPERTLAWIGFVLFQPGVLKIRDAYRQVGFLPARYPAVSDDYIGLECDFLSNLAAEALQAFDDGDEASCALRLQQSLDFLEQHLLRWVGSLADALRQASPEGLYAPAADFAAACMRRDRDMLRSLLSVIGV